MNADSKKVRLQSLDGEVVEVDTEIINLSNLIKRKMEDLPESDTIQLPNVNAAILHKVVHWCEYHKNYTPPLEEDENKEKRTDDEVRKWDAKFLKANQEVLYDLSLAANYMGIERLLDLTTPIRQLPSELLVKIIENLPRTQWPALELVDHKFQDAVLLAWGSLRMVDIQRDFIYSESKVIIYENDYNSEMVKGRLRREIAQKTEAILKKLSERSPLITSLTELSLITDDPTLNTTAVQYLSEFKHLETIKFADSGIPLISLIEFIESTQSRAALKIINIEQLRWDMSVFHAPSVVANFDRLRAAFANVSNDPTRGLLQLESFSMRVTGWNHPLTFFDSIDVSKLTKLSSGHSYVDPTVLTTLINGAQQLRHLDFAFLQSCHFYANTPVCQGGRLQPNKELLAVLGSHPNLTSLGINSMWGMNESGCACHGFEAEFKNMLHTIGPQLEKLVFEPFHLPPDIPVSDVRDIIRHRMPCLKSIKLDDCCAKNPEDLRGIADGKELEEIEISLMFCYDDAGFRSILNEVLSTILSKSPRLKRFNVYYSPDQRVVDELCKLSDLIDLRISADRLTAENFVAFSQLFAEKLEILHLGAVEEGVESGLIELIGKAHQLRELNVHRNTTDRLLECVAESCPNLEKFCACSANRITLGGVQMLVDRCPNLRWLQWLRKEGSAYTFASYLKDLKLGRYRKLELY